MSVTPYGAAARSVNETVLRGAMADGEPQVRLRVSAYGSADEVCWTGGADTPCGDIKRAILAQLGLGEYGRRRYDLHLGSDLLHPMPFDVSFGEFLFGLVGINLTLYPHPVTFCARLIRRF